MDLEKGSLSGYGGRIRFLEEAKTENQKRTKRERNCQ